MKGSFTISISNNKISYKFEIHRNLTIVRGDSATGKTTLYSMVYDYASLGKKSGVKIQCDRECTVLPLKDWEKSLKSIKDSIVFIDEGNEDISSPAFAREIKKTNNYYVFFVRENLHELPYSVEEIYRVACKGKKHWLEKIYQPNPNHILSQSQKISFETILTEDSNSGYQFFKEYSLLFSKNCFSASGKTKIYSWLKEHKGEKIMIVADGAALGPEINLIKQLDQQQDYHISVFVPESFEWLILNSGTVSSNEILTILDNPTDYIESRDYFSWEQFFTDLLKKTTKDTIFAYNKKTINKRYLSKENIMKIADGLNNYR